ncbi:hypothetical protein MAR_005469 [Mya arenaria]|uniref:CD59 glycoprotein-like n=1 Tax=Mya arenaria TaxID=6604 RepID=A0ABY7F3K6_MYAAR|nr:uncharacterized protein LOC128245700 [Mya arenaria]WAR15364.1 hypothetical protein MAR_005469 [Mya arenaria]
MNTLVKSVVAVAFVLMLSARTAYGIECYSCVAGDTKCKDEFNADGVLTSTSCTSCTKTKDGDSVARGCSTTYKGFDGCVENKDEKQALCFCKKDKCNNASGLTVTMATIASALLLSHLLKKM